MPWFQKDKTDYRKLIEEEREKTREKKGALAVKVTQVERLESLMIEMLAERARDA